METASQQHCCLVLGGQAEAGPELGVGAGSDQSWETEEVGLWRFWSRWVLTSKGIWDWLWMKANEAVRTTVQCVLCKVYFSARPNKLRPVLKFKEYYPIEHIFAPACSSARKIHFFLSFSDFQTLDPWFPPKYVTVSTPSSVIMALYPPLLLIVSDTAS